MNKLITLEDFAVRDQRKSVEEWLLWKCEQSIAENKIKLGWDGKSVDGEAVLAFVNYGRWIARCKVCSNPLCVSHKTPVFYCPECGNGGSQAAWPVQFPKDLHRLEEALLKREIRLREPVRFIRNNIEYALNCIPAIRGLGRDWRPGIELEQIEAENEEAMKAKARGRSKK